MPDILSLFDSLKSDVAELAKNTVGELAGQATSATHQQIDRSKEKLEQYAKEFAAGQLKLNELEDLLNGEKALAVMELHTQIGMAKIQADKFMDAVTGLLIGTVTEIAKFI